MHGQRGGVNTSSHSNQSGSFFCNFSGVDARYIINNVYLCGRKHEKRKNMSTATLTNLRDYLYGTLSTSDMMWLVEEMKEHMRSSEDRLKPYTKEELHARIAQSELDIAEGRVYDFDDVMRELEEEFADEDARELAKAV